MYAVATFEMADAMSLGFLDFVPHVFFWVALAAWLLTFVGMARSVVRSLTPSAASGVATPKP
jgi:hypothetical protein